jgi:hypothetical protein
MSEGCSTLNTTASPAAAPNSFASAGLRRTSSLCGARAAADARPWNSQKRASTP